ncbi:MAG: phage shock protein operon transcriptional activator [Vibrio sp.]
MTPTSPQSPYIGQSHAFLEVLDQTSRLANIMRPVLILGERGTGKEMIAQRLHYLSKRWQQPLVSLNCSALSEGLIDSELFGHESGAFTGAKQKHQGRFERAHQGSLFLDELATMPLQLQEKLLRVIEYGEFERVGGHKALQADVRLICATNQDLPQLAKDGLFRYDLLDRLAFDVIHMPALRERQEDILPLAEHFAIGMCQELGYAYFAGFSQNATDALHEYAWPGNIRELKNTVERAVYQQGDNGQPIEALNFDPFAKPMSNTGSEMKKPTDDDVPSPASASQQAQALTQAVKTTDDKPHDPLPTLPVDFKAWQHQQEAALVKKALAASQYNQKQAAKQLTLSYHQFRGLLRKHQI